MRTDVACTLTISSPVPATALLQVAVATPTTEELTIVSAGQARSATETQVHGARVHELQVAAGETTIAYSASVESGGAPRTVTAADRAEYVRPSRYCPSDQVEGFAAAEFDQTIDRSELVAQVASWVSGRLVYVAGASRPVDTAIDTLLAGSGVCRDYTHLTVMLLRALEVPARLVAVYAPGLSPMDFHAVVEADVDGVWRTVDPTRLAPTSSLVRICHGRDAADTAFLSLFGGRATLGRMTVTATVDGQLPAPSDEPFALA
ncbi:Transglutaminase-like superfamily protein [Klenkia soli]|uniref:Transglutaminase-like superfamily protein n=1 Tax=Klenkia soli TaxID=1052260 RepID=A0A1H0KFB5_9ACTN|nr:transglutaminase family protein [Klenkia soli]SDO54658.1 Transglutaminase-like superfamily protein [Klenkia soli]